MADFAITTTADFDNGTKSDIVTITDEYVVGADEIALSFPYADKDANLISYWRFENNGTDQTGANDITNNGALFTAAGKFDGAFDYTRGDTDYHGSSGRPDTAFQGSLVAWIKFDDVPAATYSSYAGLGDSDANAFMRFHLFTDGSNGRVIFDHRPNASATYDSVIGENTMVAGTWYMVVVTSDGSTWKLYLNDNGEDTTIQNAPNTGAWFGDTVPGTPNWAIGASWFNGAADSGFDGKIDEVKLYDKELTPAEIVTLFNSGNQYVSSGNWRSASQTMTAGKLLDDVIITHSGLDGSNYIDTVEILQASDNAVLSTASANITTGASTTLTASDFDNGFDPTLNTNFKVKTYLVGDGSTASPILTDISGNYAVSQIYPRMDGEVFADATDILPRFDGEVFA